MTCPEGVTVARAVKISVPLWKRLFSLLLLRGKCVPFPSPVVRDTKAPAQGVTTAMSWNYGWNGGGFGGSYGNGWNNSSSGWSNGGRSWNSWEQDRGSRWNNGKSGAQRLPIAHMCDSFGVMEKNQGNMQEIIRASQIVGVRVPNVIMPVFDGTRTLMICNGPPCGGAD